MRSEVHSTTEVQVEGCGQGRRASPSGPYTRRRALTDRRFREETHASLFLFSFLIYNLLKCKSLGVCGGVKFTGLRVSEVYRVWEIFGLKKKSSFRVSGVHRFGSLQVKVFICCCCCTLGFTL